MRVDLFTLKFHMLYHISKASVTFVEFELLDVASFQHCNNTVGTFDKVASLKKGSSVKNAVQTMNVLVEDKACKYKKISKSRRSLLARDTYRISIAEVQYYLHARLASPTSDARASVKKCVSEHSQGDSISARNMTLPTCYILTVVVTWRCFCAGREMFELLCMNLLFSDKPTRTGFERKNVCFFAIL